MHPVTRDRESGFTLVEMLVVVVLLGVVGAVATTAMIRALKTTDSGQARVYGLADVQKAVERMSRELRAADPLQTMTATTVSARVYRNGKCDQYTYALVGTEIRQTVERLTPDPGPWNECSSVLGSGVTTVLARDISNGAGTPLFTYLAETAPAPVAATTTATVREIRIDARSALSGEGPLRVATSVQIRNFDTARYRSHS